MNKNEDWLCMVSISEPIFDRIGRYVWLDLSSNDPIEDIIICNAIDKYGHGSYEAANLVKNDILRHRSQKTCIALARMAGCEL